MVTVVPATPIAGDMEIAGAAVANATGSNVASVRIKNTMLMINLLYFIFAYQSHLLLMVRHTLIPVNFPDSKKAISPGSAGASVFVIICIR